jgi:hypothetical protein
MKDLIEELGLEGREKGEQAVALIQSSLFIELERIREDVEPMVNLIRLSLIGYEPEGDRKRMN